MDTLSLQTPGYTVLLFCTRLGIPRHTTSLLFSHAWNSQSLPSPMAVQAMLPTMYCKLQPLRKRPSGGVVFCIEIGADMQSSQHLGPGSVHLRRNIITAMLHNYALKWLTPDFILTAFTQRAL